VGAPADPRLVRFGPFALDTRAGELRKHGIKIKLREQPVRILGMLLEHPGEVVLREEIRTRLWPNNTIVEFDHGINAAIQKLRDALGDSANEPRYVETVARRGYRFVGQLEKAADDSQLEGTTLSHYRILEQLGEGGMGVVWRAHDPRLNRDVAIKISAEKFSDRFEHEARAIAALNHPNICTLYDVGPNFLVMELIEGESPKGPLPLDEALRIARQIADALDAAHEKGIVHRDLKPGNIKIKPDGTVKVLDFGLAKTIEAPSGDPEDSPTVTVAGMIMGTAAYMSPEQARGKIVDKRADIWAFGVVLYELLTGRRPFHGNDLQEMLASVMKDQPDMSGVPVQVRPLVYRCLEKDPKKRLRDIGDVWGVGQGHALPSHSQLKFAWGAAALLAVGLATILFLYLRDKPDTPNASPDLALSIVPPTGLNLDVVGGLNVDRISPDGSMVLYRASDNRFHLRQLSSLQDQLIPPFRWYGEPFWAPDSKSIAFPTVGGLIKMQVPNGAPEVFSARSAERGGSWGDKGIFLVVGLDSSPGGVSLYGVSAEGGKAFPVEVPGFKEGSYYNPEFLPGGDDFLFLFCPLDSAEAQVFIATLRGGKAIDPRLLFSNDTAAAFTNAGGGRILFVRNDNLYSQKLDVKARHLVGVAELVQERVASHSPFRNANFSVSRNGAIVWRSGTALVSQVAVFDRKGNRIGTAGTAVPADIIRLAPDEAHLLVVSEAGSWIMESNGPGFTRLRSPTLGHWSPDGSEVVGVKGAAIVRRPVSGSSEFRPWAGLPAVEGVSDISTDGRRILYQEGSSLLWFSLDKSRSETVVEQRVDGAVLSPDGSWTVYHPLTQSGIYVQPLTNPGLRKQIASGGGWAVWRKDGKEIVYWNQDRIWSVRVDGVGAQLHFAPPEPLFSVARPLGLLSGARPLAVNRDGSRIYFLQSTEEPDSGFIHIRTRAIR
jgi:serine/threonine protein kinase